MQMPEIKTHGTFDCINPTEELDNLFCNNGGRKVQMECYNDYWIQNDILRAKAARKVTYELPYSWRLPIRSPKLWKSVTEKLRKHLDITSKDRLELVVPTPDGYYGVFLVISERNASERNAIYEVRKIDKLLKRSGLLKKGKLKEMYNVNNFA